MWDHQPNYETVCAATKRAPDRFGYTVTGDSGVYRASDPSPRLGSLPVRLEAIDRDCYGATRPGVGPAQSIEPTARVGFEIGFATLLANPHRHILHEGDGVPIGNRVINQG